MGLSVSLLLLKSNCDFVFDSFAYLGMETLDIQLCLPLHIFVYDGLPLLHPDYTVEVQFL